MVFVFHSERVDDLTLDGLREDLPRRVAVALSCDDPDGHLDSRDVEVRFVPHGPRDVTNYDVEIVIYDLLIVNRDEFSGILPRNSDRNRSK